MNENSSRLLVSKRSDSFWRPSRTRGRWKTSSVISLAIWLTASTGLVGGTGVPSKEPSRGVINAIFLTKHLLTSRCTTPMFQDDDARLVIGLRERRLFALAELHCRKLLARTDLTPTELASLTIELITTQTAKAILSTGTDRELAWQAAEQTAAQFLMEHPHHSRTVLVQVQSALGKLSQGQVIRQELAAEMVPASARETALEVLRQANSQLSEIQRGITKLIAEQRGRSLPIDDLRVEELMALNNNVRFQLAITNVNRAQLYAADDRLNRVDALSNVLERLEEIQRETAAGQPLWWDSQVLQIECFRLLGQYPKAQGLADQLAATIDDNVIPTSLLEQQLLLTLNSGDAEAAAKAVQQTENTANRTPQLDLARLSVLMDLSNRSDTAEKSQWLNRAAQVAREIETQHGGYWGRRAKLALISASGVDLAVNSGGRSATTGSSSAELDLLIGLAEQAERNGRFDDAVKAYDRAAAAASQLGAQPQAFSYSVRASQALEKQQLHELAAQRLIELANQNTSYELASAAHLRGCWNWAQVIGDDAEKKLRFTELLTEHLQAWPTADSTGQIRVWLGGQQQVIATTAPQWQLAYDTYRAVPTTSTSFGDSLSRASYCANQWFDKTPTTEQKTVAATVFQQLQSILESTPPGSPANGQAILVVAEFGLRTGATDPRALKEPLAQLIATSTDVLVQRRGQACLYSIQAFDDGPADSAAALLEQFADDKKWLALAEQGITAIAAQHPDWISTQSMTCRLQVIETALTQFRTTLSPRETTAWLYRKSDALAALKRDQEALDVLLKLELELNNDASLQLRIARLLTQIDGAQEPAKPLAKWRLLATQLKPHSAAWYEAKFQVANLLVQSGQPADARKMLEYLQAIPPGWENSELRQEFEALLKRLQ